MNMYKKNIITHTIINPMCDNYRRLKKKIKKRLVEN